MAIKEATYNPPLTFDSTLGKDFSLQEFESGSKVTIQELLPQENPYDITPDQLRVKHWKYVLQVNPSGEGELTTNISSMSSTQRLSADHQIQFIKEFQPPQSTIIYKALWWEPPKP